MRTSYFEDKNGNQLRVFESHFRNIFLSNGNSLYLPIPRSICWVKAASGSILAFHAWAFIEDDIPINLNMLVWPPPLPSI
jgi:hypothetical protein